MGSPPSGLLAVAQTSRTGSSEAQAVLARTVAAGGKVEAIRTAKRKSREVPAAREGAVKEHGERACGPGAQTQPESLATATNSVKSGTVSVTVTGPAF